jgi:hypothetical protein
MTDESVCDVEPVAHADDTREVTIDGTAWIARLAGEMAAGSGAFGLGFVACIDFALASEPHTPLRQALIQRGMFTQLFDAEIIALFRRSQPLIQQQVVTRRSLEDSH